MNPVNRHIFLALVVGLSLASLLCAEEPKRDRIENNVLERFKVAQDGDCLLLPVKYKGKTYQFLIDSGSTWNVFDSSLPLGNPIDESDIKGAADAVRLKLYDAPSATVGGLSLKSTEPVVAFDFTRLRQVTGYEVYGFIGMPFLRRNVLRVDFDKGELLVLKKPSSDCGQEFAVNFNEGGIPRISVKVVGDEKQKFLLDTGLSSTGDLATKSFDTLLRNADLTVFGTRLFETISGTSEIRIGRLKQLSLGDFTVRGAAVSEAEESSLGLGFCSRFVMTLDLANDKVYLKKGKNFDRVDAHDLSGLHLLRMDGKVVVHSVGKRTAAEAAGIKVGDLLVKIDDTKTEELSMFKLRQRFSTVTKKLRVTICREEKETEVVLVLSREEVGEK
jgi:PDZ domain/Aspartyl protease